MSSISGANRGQRPRKPFRWERIGEMPLESDCRAVVVENQYWAFPFEAVWRTFWVRRLVLALPLTAPLRPQMIPANSREPVRAVSARWVAWLRTREIAPFRPTTLLMPSTLLLPFRPSAIPATNPRYFLLSLRHFSWWCYCASSICSSTRLPFYFLFHKPLIHHDFHTELFINCQDQQQWVQVNYREGVKHNFKKGRKRGRKHARTSFFGKLSRKVRIGSLVPVILIVLFIVQDELRNVAARLVVRARNSKHRSIRGAPCGWQLQLALADNLILPQLWPVLARMAPVRIEKRHSPFPNNFDTALVSAAASGRN